jgi:hypothetical protein
MKTRLNSRSLLLIVLVGLLLNITVKAQTSADLQYSNYIRNPDFATITGCSSGTASCPATNVGTNIYLSASGAAPWFFTNTATSTRAPSEPNLKFDLVSSVNGLTGAAANAYGVLMIDNQEQASPRASVCASQQVKYFPKGKWFIKAVAFVRQVSGNPQVG